MATAEEQITALVEGADFKGLVTFCENFELDLGHSEVAAHISIGVYKLHLLGHLLLGQLDLARFVWKRLPLGKNDPELVAIWEVGKQMWQEDHAGVQAALAAHAWSPPLVERLAAALRRQCVEAAFRKIGMAYASILPESLAAKLGVPLQTVQELATEHGWTVDIATGALRPVQREGPPPEGAHLESLQQLTNFVAHLEHEVK